MTSLQFLTLILHLFLGLAAVICSCAIWMMLQRQKFDLMGLQRVSMWAFVLMLLSWVTAASYYVSYYGRSVKPIILAGKYPWAHTVMTESKEHFFLFLPFLTLVLFFVLWTCGKQLQKDARLRFAVRALAGITAFLGIAVTLFGVVISGAVR